MNRYFLLPLLLGCIIAAGCSSEPQKSSEPAPENLKPESLHGAGAPAAVANPLKFDIPEGWVKETPSSSSRQMQFKLPSTQGDKEDAEVVVFYFGGGGGTPQANVERWVAQFTTPDGKPVNDKAKTSHKDINGIHVTLVEASGTYFSSMGPMQGAGEPKPNYRMLGAIAETQSGPWFVKFTGPERTVARWEPSFNSFLSSMKQ
jgi:hypothetical protein